MAVPGPAPRPALDRLAERFEIDVFGCWRWSGAGSNGYSTFTVEGIAKGAHRAVYELLVGPIPDGMQIDHLCGVRRCVNPDHLEPVTARENTRRALKSLATINAAKTHCVHGHEFTPSNTYVPPKRPNRRYCRECNRLRQYGRIAQEKG